jgi:hypothetical protein
MFSLWVPRVHAIFQNRISTAFALTAAAIAGAGAEWDDKRTALR